MFYKTSNSCFNAFMRPDKLKDHSWMILCGSYSDIPVVKKKYHIYTKVLHSLNGEILNSS